MDDWMRKYFQKLNSTTNPQTTMAPTHYSHNNSNVGTPSMCILREGAKIYFPLQTNGFGSTVILCRFSNMNKNTHVQYQNKGVKTCYILSEGETVVNLATIQDKTTSLVEVSAPFLGTVFVEADSIVSVGPEEQGTRRVLMG